MEDKKRHAILVPFPGQGHMNPMMQFARRLVSKGLKATLVTPVFIAKSMHLSSSIGQVHLDVISDGYDELGRAAAPSTETYLARLKAEGSRTLAGLILKHQSTPTPIDCVVYEPFLAWALDVAKEFGVMGAAFFTQPCTVISSSGPVSIPGLPLKLELRDMPSFVAVPDSYPANFLMQLNQFSNTGIADFILINTFYKLELEAMDTMSKVCPVLTIGPTIPSIYLDRRIEKDDEYNIDLFTSDASVSTKWLSDKPPRSVVYVAFGSFCDLSEKQMEELARGLERSNFYFLWIVRVTEQAKLPKTFIEELGDRGCVASWSRQVEVLANQAVGCFLTHCGWNSTIEALSLGVPMVAMPQWSDQPSNAKLVEDVWKVGIRVRVGEDGLVSGEEIQCRVRQVMVGEKGKEIKKNAEKWRDLAIEAVSQGGSSDANIDKFVAELDPSGIKVHQKPESLSAQPQANKSGTRQQRHQQPMNRQPDQARTRPQLATDPTLVNPKPDHHGLDLHGPTSEAHIHRSSFRHRPPPPRARAGTKQPQHTPASINIKSQQNQRLSINGPQREEAKEAKRKEEERHQWLTPTTGNDGGCKGDDCAASTPTLGSRPRLKPESSNQGPDILPPGETAPGGTQRPPADLSPPGNTSNRQLEEGSGDSPPAGDGDAGLSLDLEPSFVIPPPPSLQPRRRRRQQHQHPSTTQRRCRREWKEGEMVNWGGNTEEEKERRKT
ncbi:hypothetical protein Tsubulata_003343, partial [Turnera subulata]